MSNDLKDVVNWYSSEKSYDYMSGASKNGLKIWENEVVNQYFTEKSHILDIGCGTGREAFALYDLGYQITAVDISKLILKQAIQLAAQTDRKINFTRINGLDLPFEDGSFDSVIIWSQTFGLMYGEANKKHILNECKRVLKNNGILSFSTHDRVFEEQHYPQYLEGNKFWAYKECYWETFSIDELKAFADSVGLKVLDCLQGKIYKPEDGIIIHCICQK